MKLRKQAGLKAAIVGFAAGLMLLFSGIVKANPGIEAEADAPASPTPDYDRFFAPNRAATPSSMPVDRPVPHTRTRAS